MSKEAVLFEQCYLMGRVVQSGDSEWKLEFSVLGGDTHSFTFTDEMEAKGAYRVIEEFYFEALKKVQNQFVEIHDQTNDGEKTTLYSWEDHKKDT